MDGLLDPQREAIDVVATANKRIVGFFIYQAVVSRMRLFKYPWNV